MSASRAHRSKALPFSGLLLTRPSINNKDSRAATANTTLTANKATLISPEVATATQSHIIRDQNLSITAAVDTMTTKNQQGALEATVSSNTNGIEIPTDTFTAMTNMNGSNGQGQDRILNEVRGVDRAIDEIENELSRLSGLQNRYLADTDTSPTSALRQEVDRVGEIIMAKYRSLAKRVKVIKSNPESGSPRNSAQVGKVDRRLKTAINQYQQVERDYRKKMQDQIARQYRIVRPDASDSEVREAVEDTSNHQVFSDALINSDRRGQAQTAAENVRSRHENIQKIERDMMELAQMFQDLDVLVVQQEAAVTNIEQKGEEVNDHVQGANTELDGAVKKARAARRKKWYCLGIAGKSMRSVSDRGSMLIASQ
jgi:syntaxin 1B/2/3